MTVHYSVCISILVYDHRRTRVTYLKSDKMISKRIAENELGAKV